MRRTPLLKSWLESYAASLPTNSAQKTGQNEEVVVEQQAILRMLDLLHKEEDAFSRHTLSPGHFTNSAFVLHENKLLLIHHQKLNMWIQPGGHVEPDDTNLLQGARREVCEETFLPLHELELIGDEKSPLFDLDIHEIPKNKKEEAHFHFDVRFLFRIKDASAAKVGDGVKGLEFVDLDQVHLMQSDASVMRAVEKIRLHSL